MDESSDAAGNETNDSSVEQLAARPTEGMSVITSQRSDPPTGSELLQHLGEAINIPHHYDDEKSSDSKCK